MAQTTNFRLEIFRHTFCVSIPCSISADEAVRATAGDVSEHAEATDRLEIRQLSCWFAVNRKESKSPPGVRDEQPDRKDEHRGNGA